MSKRKPVKVTVINKVVQEDLKKKVLDAIASAFGLKIKYQNYHKENYSFSKRKLPFFWHKKVIEVEDLTGFYNGSINIKVLDQKYINLSNLLKTIIPILEESIKDEQK